MPAGAGSAGNLVDVTVGARIRIRRRLLNLNQADLAEALGVTFQQIQKYEDGSQRVTAARLYDIARRLGAPITYFFEGLPGPTKGSTVEGPAADELAEHLATPGAVELLRAFSRIETPALRQQVIALLSSMSVDPAHDASAAPYLDPPRRAAPFGGG